MAERPGAMAQVVAELLQRVGDLEKKTARLEQSSVDTGCAGERYEPGRLWDPANPALVDFDYRLSLGTPSISGTNKYPCIRCGIVGSRKTPISDPPDVTMMRCDNGVHCEQRRMEREKIALSDDDAFLSSQSETGFECVICEFRSVRGTYFRMNEKAEPICRDSVICSQRRAAQYEANRIAIASNPLLTPIRSQGNIATESSKAILIDGKPADICIRCGLVALLEDFYPPSPMGGPRWCKIRSECIARLDRDPDASSSLEVGG